MSVPFGKYWRSSPFVFSFDPALPRRFGVAEVDLDAGIDRELGVLGHLFALIPRQRLPEMVREALDGRFKSDPHRFCVLAVGEWEQHHVAGPAFDQGPDRGLAFAHDQVAFPMAGHRTVLDRSGPFTDHDGVDDLAFARRRPGAFGPPVRPTGAEMLW